MGLLRALQQRNNSVDWLEADPTLLPDEYLERSRQEHAAREAILAEENRQFAARIVDETVARQATPRRRGRPAQLETYKEYQQAFLSRWSKEIWERSGWRQQKLADEFGLTDATDWRDMQRGHLRKCRLPVERFRGCGSAISAVMQRGWARAKVKQNVVSFWLTQAYMTQDQLVEWAQKIQQGCPDASRSLMDAPQFSNGDFVRWVERNARHMQRNAALMRQSPV